MNTGSVYYSGCSTERIAELSRWKRAPEMQGHAACEMSGNFHYLRRGNFGVGEGSWRESSEWVTEFGASGRVGVSDSEERWITDTLTCMKLDNVFRG